MEVRERRNPRETREKLATVENDLPDSVEYDSVPETREFTPSARSTTKVTLNPSWPYPVKPAFSNDENYFDDDDDDEDDDDDGEDMAMMTTCCCCFTTKNGSIAVGVITMVIAFLASVALCFALIKATILEEQFQSYYESYKEQVAHNLTLNKLSIVNNIISVDLIIDNLQVIIIVCFAFYGIYTFSCLFLTYGACSDLRSLLLPWIVLEFIPFAIQLAGIVVVFVYGKDDPTLSSGGIYIIAGLVQIVCFVIHVYWWMCPVAHFQNLKDTTEVEQLISPSHPLYPSVQKY